jgi:hypothetical protein
MAVLTARGSLFGFTQFLPTGPAFPQCTACSSPVIQLFKVRACFLLVLLWSRGKWGLTVVIWGGEIGKLGRNRKYEDGTENKTFYVKICVQDEK